MLKLTVLSVIGAENGCTGSAELSEEKLKVLCSINTNIVLCVERSKQKSVLYSS